ncbi:hypothetical protein L9F63_020965, partial [Diploptera punctata]
SNLLKKYSEVIGREPCDNTDTFEMKMKLVGYISIVNLQVLAFFFSYLLPFLQILEQLVFRLTLTSSLVLRLYRKRQLQWQQLIPLEPRQHYFYVLNIAYFLQLLDPELDCSLYFFTS